MEGVPSNIPCEEVRKAILEVRGVTGVFDIHIWAITSDMDALSAHVVVIDLGRSHAILQELNSLLEKRFNITHATIQIERQSIEEQHFTIVNQRIYLTGLSRYIQDNWSLL